MDFIFSVVRAFRQGQRANEAFKLVPTLFGIVPGRGLVEKLYPRVGRMADFNGKADLALYIATKCLEDLPLTPESALVALRARMAVDVGKPQGVFTNELFLADFHFATARLVPADEDEQLPHPLPEQGWSGQGDCIVMSDPPEAFENLPDWLLITPERTQELDQRVGAKKLGPLSRVVNRGRSSRRK